MRALDSELGALKEVRMRLPLVGPRPATLTSTWPRSRTLDRRR